jgi:acetate kinase
MRPVFLVLNAGSSSIKFQLFDAAGTGEPRRIYRGLFEGFGSSPHFLVRDKGGAAVGEARWGETERFGHEEALAHLGNEASLCALDNGTSTATTMGFSALDGLPMGTRCGAIDAGVVFYMLREMKLGADEAERVLYTKCGPLGVSGISNDMRKLRSLAASDPDARQAIDLFVYRIGRELGSLVAALGGIDALVFTGGIGENDRATRAEVLRAAAWAGFELDEAANADGGPRITRGAGPSAWVIPTD